MKKRNKIITTITLLCLVIMSTVITYKINNRPATDEEIKDIVDNLNERYGITISADFGSSMGQKDKGLSKKEVEELLVEMIEQQLDGNEEGKLDNYNELDRLAKKYNLKK